MDPDDPSTCSMVGKLPIIAIEATDPSRFWNLAKCGRPDEPSTICLLGPFLLLPSPFFFFLDFFFYIKMQTSSTLITGSCVAGIMLGLGGLLKFSLLSFAVARLSSSIEKSVGRRGDCSGLSGAGSMITR